MMLEAARQNIQHAPKHSFLHLRMYQYDAQHILFVLLHMQHPSEAHLCIRDVLGGVPYWQDAALLHSISGRVEGDFEIAFKASPLLRPLAYIVLLLLRCVEGHAMGKNRSLI